MRSDRIDMILKAAAVAAFAGLCFLLPVALSDEDERSRTANLPPEGEPMVMVWRDQAIPEAHIALRRGGGYFSPGPDGSLLEDSPPSYWEDIR